MGDVSRQWSHRQAGRRGCNVDSRAAEKRTRRRKRGVCQRQVGCTGRMEVRRSTIRTGNGCTKQWATNDGQSKKARGGASRKTQGRDLVEAATKRRPVQRGGRSQQRRQIQSRSRRGPGCAGDVPRRAISRERKGWRPAAVGGSGVEWSTDGRTVAPKGLGSGPTCMRRDRSPHGQQRRRGESREMQSCRAARGQNLLLVLRWLLALGSWLLASLPSPLLCRPGGAGPMGGFVMVQRGPGSLDVLAVLTDPANCAWSLGSRVQQRAAGLGKRRSTEGRGSRADAAGGAARRSQPLVFVWTVEPSGGHTGRQVDEVRQTGQPLTLQELIREI